MMSQNLFNRTPMLVLAGFTAGIALSLIGGPSAHAQQGLTRTVIMKKDLESDPKKEVTVFIAQYQPGARSGKHYHPGQEFIYVIEGEGVMEEVGKAPVEMKPGMMLYFQSDPSNPAYVHEATDLGKTAGMKLLVTLITEKGQPLAYPLKK
jgi:quercetin dioxygenase-like cupin family protein